METILICLKLNNLCLFMCRIINQIKAIMKLLFTYLLIQMIRTILSWSKNSFCMSKSYFRASQVITKTLFQFDREGANQGKQIFQSIDQDTQIEDAAKQQVKKMFDPQHGFQLPEGFQTIPRFKLALNQLEQYAMNPNAIMLSTAAKTMLRCPKNTNKFQYAGGYGQFIYGTSGSSKSCSFFNFAKILNMKVPQLIKNKSPKDSLFRQNAKIFFLLTFQNRNQQFRRILNEIKVDFGQQEYEKLVMQYQQNKELYQQNNVKARNFIQQIFDFYRKKGLKVIVILDQFNSLYNEGKELQIQQFDQVPLFKEIHQSSSKPTYLISSKNIEFLNRDLTKNMTKFDPIVRIFSTDQNVVKINVENKIMLKLKDCVNQIAFETYKQIPDHKFVDQVIKKLNPNVPISTHFNIASLIKKWVAQNTDKKTPDVKQFVEYLQKKINVDVDRMEKNIEENPKILQLIVLFFSGLREQQLSTEYLTSQNEKIQISKTFLYFDLSQFADDIIKEQIQKIAQINFFEKEKNKIYTTFNVSQIISLYWHAKTKFPEIVGQYAKKFGVLQKILKTQFEQQVKSLISQELIGNKEQKICYFVIKLQQQYRIDSVFPPSKQGNKNEIKYLKLQNINKTVNWQKRIRENKFNVQSSQNVFEPNLHQSYSWDELMATFQRNCNYISSNINNQAFDFIVSLNNGNQLKIFFVDLTYADPQQNYAENKCKKNAMGLMNNPNFQTLIQGINGSTKAKEISVYFYVLFLKGRKFEQETQTWQKLELQKPKYFQKQNKSISQFNWGKLQKLNKKCFYIHANFGNQFMILKEDKSFGVNDLINYRLLKQQKQQFIKKD